MRTARAVVVLAGNARPRAFATLEQANESLDKLADGAARLSDTRFVGYDTDALPANVQTQVPTGARVAIYEADYADPPVIATTLANVAAPLRQGHKARH